MGSGRTTRQRSAAAIHGPGGFELKVGGSSQGYTVFREFLPDKTNSQPLFRT
jgi:hypothetical protein